MRLCGILWIIQEVAGDHKEFRREVGDQLVEFGGLVSDIPEEGFLFHLKEPFCQAGQRAGQ